MRILKQAFAKLVLIFCRYGMKIFQILKRNHTCNFLPKWMRGTGLSRCLPSNWQKTKSRVWELAVLVEEAGAVCAEQSMSQPPCFPFLASAYRLPLNSSTLLWVVVVTKEMPVCLLPCPCVSPDNPSLPPTLLLAPAVGDLGQ